MLSHPWALSAWQHPNLLNPGRG
ncbi:hypothetical protein QTP86_004073, partial [Hemibagrus guttatus]